MSVNNQEQVTQSFQMILDYCAKFEKRLNNSMHRVMSGDFKDDSDLPIVVRYHSVDIMCLLNELELNKKQLDILKKHINYQTNFTR